MGLKKLLKLVIFGRKRRYVSQIKTLKERVRELEASLNTARTENRLLKLNKRKNDQVPPR